MHFVWQLFTYIGQVDKPRYYNPFLAALHFDSVSFYFYIREAQPSLFIGFLSPFKSFHFSWASLVLRLF